MLILLRRRKKKCETSSFSLKLVKIAGSVLLIGLCELRLGVWNMYNKNRYTRKTHHSARKNYHTVPKANLTIHESLQTARKIDHT